MKTREVIELKLRNDSIVYELLVVWEASVRATHHFLNEKDIETLKPLVFEGLRDIERLFYIVNEAGQAIAFGGVQGDKLEMLFVDPDNRSKGVGKLLVEYAIRQLDVCYVNVNEQNPQAIGFYEHMGFRTFSRSDLDDQGNPFPILHMERSNDESFRLK